MQSFKDTTGREWELRMTIGLARRLKESVLKVDLLNIDEGKPPLAVKLEMDPALLCNVIFLVVEKQAKELQVDEQAFCDALDGDVFEAADKAFWQDLIDFFLKLGRNDLCQVIRTQRELRGKVVDDQAKRIQEIDLQQLVDENRMTRGKTSGDSQESLDSTRSLSLSEN